MTAEGGGLEWTVVTEGRTQVNTPDQAKHHVGGSALRRARARRLASSRYPAKKRRRLSGGPCSRAPPSPTKITLFGKAPRSAGVSKPTTLRHPPFPSPLSRFSNGGFPSGSYTAATPAGTSATAAGTGGNGRRVSWKRTAS